MPTLAGLHLEKKFKGARQTEKNLGVGEGVISLLRLASWDFL